MLFDIEHVTRYTYTGPVTLDPHVFRLRPREDASQRLRRFALHVDPAPAGLAEAPDLEGNAAARAWFDGTTEALEVRSVVEVQTLRTNPYDFVLEPWQSRLPAATPEALAERLGPYLGWSGAPAVAALARAAVDEAGGDTVAFLAGLTRRLHRDLRGMVRREGAPWAPAETLARGEGACRDLAVLLMDACRSVGLPARFVSGYHDPGPGRPERELHAWAEVHLAGAGWRGFDPSAGEAVADRHVAVAAGPAPRDAAPLEGSFRSAGARGTLEARIAMRVRPDPAPGEAPGERAPKPSA